MKSSIDNIELAKFNKTYEEWQDKEGEFKLLHKINSIRLEYVLEKAKAHFSINRSLNHLPLQGLKIIDVGCGGGIVSVPLASTGANMVGIDANKYNIEAAITYAKEQDLQSLSFVNTTIEEHVLTHAHSYDIVICFEVAEHVANPREFVINLTSLLKPGGMIILSTVNRTLKSYLLAIVAAERILGWIKKGTHEYSKFLKPSELNNFLTLTGNSIKELKGLKFNLLHSKWEISDDIDINYFAYIS